MKYIKILFIYLILLSCNNKTNDWSNIQEIDLYLKENLKTNNINNQEYKALAIDELVSILQSTYVSDELFLWKGYKLMRIKYKGNNEIFFRVSIYGGVIYDLTNKKMYKIPKEKIDDFYFLIN